MNTTLERTTPENLRLVRERMADPNRVVLDPWKVYEHKNGSTDHASATDLRAAGYEPDRACILGWAWFFDPTTETERVLCVANQEQHIFGGATYALEGGRHLEYIDRAIAYAESR